MRKAALLLLLIVGIAGPQIMRAQSTLPPVIRYHYGDNPAWAAPGFDDNSWPITADGRWPIPPLHSDGMVWVRMHIAVAPAPAGRLGLMIGRTLIRHGSERIFVQGARIAQLGKNYGRPSMVFDLPLALAPTQSAIVALRLWYLPYLLVKDGRDGVGVSIGSAPLLRAEEDAAHLEDVLGWLPYFSLHAVLALIGIGLFALWYRFRTRELLWFSLLLISYPLQNLTSEPGFLAAFVPHPPFPWFFATVPIMACAMLVTVEFLAAALNLSARGLRILLHGAWAVYCSALIVGRSITSASPLVIWVVYILIIAVSVFNLGTFFVDVHSLVRGPNRAIAFGMAIIPLGSASGDFGFRVRNILGIPHLGLFTLGFLLAGFGIAVVLTQRALSTWRQGDRLRGEFAAAREIQQRLVPVDIPTFPGCQIAAAYLPAAEVGSDFYQVLPRADGAVLVVIGDVSGKGLKAAMTGALALGALRNMAQESLSPSQILSRLNGQLAASSDGGVVTCLCARIAADGVLTLANAGHLAPYRNGEEVQLDSGLPLGVTAGTIYGESILRLNPGDSLTSLSDGVVEAQSATGELFGFDRTRAISTQSAESIARAAQAHGQQDDITVLTLTFAPAEVLHA